ncbi:MAG: hydroxysqualene dehydroxylase HpnE [Candidatus Tyrphobacter sp.]
MKVAVVGGGLAGLAAGLALCDAGCEVHLFERSRLLGGRATSFEIDGVEVDNGQHVFLGCCDEFIDFVDRLGLRSELYVQERFDALVIDRNGKAARLRAAPLPAPWHLIASFLRFRHLNLRSKLDVARALAYAKRNAAPPECTFAQWLQSRRQGAQALAAFWEPFFVPALNEPLGEMDAREALFTLRTAFLGDASAACFGYSKRPLARIAERAAQRFLNVRRSTSVSSLEICENDARALVTTAGERLEFDAFVLALTPPQLRSLLRDPQRYGIDSLDAYVPHPIVDVHLRYGHGADAGARFDFAALIGSPVQWIFRKAAGYLVCSMSAAHEYVRYANDDLVRLAWNEVRAALPVLKDARLDRGAVTRNVEATFSLPSGVERPGAKTAIENVTIAGSWTATGWPDTMESAVRSGRGAASTLLRGRAAP